MIVGKMKSAPACLRASVAGRPSAVDREKEVIRGYVVAEKGPFKSEGRGEFDTKSLRSIVSLMREHANGTKVRFGHPTMSDDGLGTYLGRAKNPRMDGDSKVRADLFFDPTAHKTPKGGDLADYVMSLAESDPDAFSSSLVLSVDEEWRLDKNDKYATDADGETLPPLWRPKKIYASDVVDTGDAVNGFLSFDNIDDSIQRLASAELLTMFDGVEDDVVRGRLAGWTERFLAWRREMPTKEQPKLTVEQAMAWIERTKK